MSLLSFIARYMPRSKIAAGGDAVEPTSTASVAPPAATSPDYWFADSVVQRFRADTLIRRAVGLGPWTEPPEKPLPVARRRDISAMVDRWPATPDDEPFGHEPTDGEAIPAPEVIAHYGFAVEHQAAMGALAELDAEGAA